MTVVVVDTETAVDGCAGVEIMGTLKCEVVGFTTSGGCDGVADITAGFTTSGGAGRIFGLSLLEVLINGVCNSI